MNALAVNLVPTCVPLLLMQGWLLNNLAMLWSAYPCMAFLVCVLCKSVHSLSHPYISQISFKKSFYGDLFLFFFIIPPTHRGRYCVAATCSIRMASIAWQLAHYGTPQWTNIGQYDRSAVVYTSIPARGSWGPHLIVHSLQLSRRGGRSRY